jgi:hypothetical protein
MSGGCGEALSVRSKPLEDALIDFFEESARYLQTDVEGGAEVALELERRGSGRHQAALYCARPLTSEYIGERWRALAGLTSYARATSALELLPGLELYVGDGGRGGRWEAARRGRRGLAQVALWMLLEEVFAEQTDFILHRERVERALGELEARAAGAAGGCTALCTLHGMTIAPAEIALAGGIAIARAQAVGEAPEELIGCATEAEPAPLLVIYRGAEQERNAAEQRARAAFQGLLGALRLFGDGRVALGDIGYLRIAQGRWRPFATPGAGRPHGMLVIRDGQEDELRAFCSLIARRRPAEGPIAWALNRYELGCARASEQEALSDYLLGLNALLEPEGAPRGALAGRLAALCAAREARGELLELVAEALALEQALIAGEARINGAGEDLIRTLGGHLRALLRDVICGHLEPDLAQLADAIIAAELADRQGDPDGGRQPEPATEPVAATIKRPRFGRPHEAPAAERTLTARKP